MLKKVLVANRGEIAVRIIRECRDNSIGAVAVYSTADRHSLHAMIADEAVCIGSAPAAESYLNMSNIIEAAKGTGCDGIHAGFGFLSENSEFAAMCEEEGLRFIGPSAEVISTMGNKASARKLMIEAGIPAVPGSDGNVASWEEAARVGDRLGYPILLKAASGGGGRGMRRVYDKSELKEAYETASKEAMSCFGDGAIYVEKLIENPRHIEIQILADAYGNIIHLGERDCSIQRRNQKMIEESPAWGISDELRTKMGNAAIKAAKAAGYENAGTVEFVMDRDSNFYFIEMNTRIQVEHPVTEMVTGINIVREQLRIASGLPLQKTQDEVKIDGHAIECRITAEKVFEDFKPCPGTVDFLHFAGGNGVRVDSALYSGCEIVPYYDSMVAKIIVKGGNRLEAVRKMRRVLEETVITGVDTTLAFQNLIMYNQAFLRGGCTTAFIDENLSGILRIYKEAEAKI